MPISLLAEPAWSLEAYTQRETCFALCGRFGGSCYQQNVVAVQLWHVRMTHPQRTAALFNSWSACSATLFRELLASCQRPYCSFCCAVIFCCVPSVHGNTGMSKALPAYSLCASNEHDFIQHLFVCETSLSHRFLNHGKHDMYASCAACNLLPYKQRPT